MFRVRKQSLLSFLTQNQIQIPRTSGASIIAPIQVVVEKMLWITAYDEACEITLKCTNQSNITLAHSQPDISEDGCYHSPFGAWSASVSNGNLLKIQFEAVEPDTTDPNKGDYVTVISKTKKGTVSTSVQINRIYRAPQK